MLSLDVTSRFAAAVGSGHFGGTASYGTAAGPAALISADLNGDGRADVVTANEGVSNVSILLAQADGTLGPATNVAVSASASDIAVGTQLQITEDIRGSRAASLLPSKS